MADENAFFEKAEATRDLYRKAAANGGKIGRLQDTGVFLGPDAPASLTSQLIPLENIADWQARVDRNAEDPIIQKFGPGATIMSLYYDAARGADAMSGEPPARAMMMATPEDLDRLWTDYFRRYPDPKFRAGTPKFMAAVRAEAARRGLM